jgi:hypothetical protein
VPFLVGEQSWTSQPFLLRRGRGKPDDVPGGGGGGSSRPKQPAAGDSPANSKSSSMCVVS